MRSSPEDYLEDPGAAGKVIDHARLLIRLAALYARIAPAHLSGSSALANYKSGTVVIHAASGAVAAKLRQLAPSLAEAFSKQGVECAAVQVKVHAATMPVRTQAATVKPLSPGTSRTLEELRGTLPESPLREALGTLLERAARKE